jgi:TolB-like protein
LKYYKRLKPVSITILVLCTVFCCIPCLQASQGSAINRPETIAILPFDINAEKNMGYIAKGTRNMLYSRLSWRNRVQVLPPAKIRSALKKLKNLHGTQKISQIASLTKSDFVLTGTITEIAGSFSIDIKVYDMDNKRYMAFFEQSKKTDDLIPKINRIAASINKRVFNRSTADWEKMEQEKKAYLRKIQRQNPEYMMQRRWHNTEKSPGWKIWKYLF